MDGQRLKKVVLWRIISVTLTLMVLLFATGSVSSATGTTLVLHAILILAHYLFEGRWDKMQEKRKWEKLDESW